MGKLMEKTNEWTLSMELRGLLINFANEIDLGYSHAVWQRKKYFISETLDEYMPQVLKLIKDHIRKSKPLSSYSDAQAALNEYEKALLEELK